MPKIVLAPDSFKECLTAHEVCTALRAGIRDASPDTEIVAKPMADGGEGTAQVLRNALDSRPVRVHARDPLGNCVLAEYELSRDGKTALVETAKANGLDLVPSDRRNPMITSTFGCGQLVAHALDQGISRLLLTIGGSSTVDGGTGLARALGYRFLDAANNAVSEGGQGLLELSNIVAPVGRAWSNIDIQVVCDVTNPLLGDLGAARVFGPQKGATPEMVELLEQGLCNLADAIECNLGVDVRSVAGGGAAGGMGAGLMTFLNARLVPGAELVSDLIGLEEAMKNADLIITGEGRTDSQTSGGKVCAAVAGLSQENGVPCVIISGSVPDQHSVQQELGVVAALSLSKENDTLEQAIAEARERLRLQARELMGNLETYCG